MTISLIFLRSIAIIISEGIEKLKRFEGWMRTQERKRYFLPIFHNWERKN